MTSDRYARHLLQWGEEKQRIIGASSLLIAGAGGLGSMVSQLMVRAGIGCLYLVDNGTVDWPDLNRQTLYCEKDVGRKKADIAGQRLKQINSTTRIIPIDRSIDTSFSIPADVHGVADCLDNFSARFDLFNSTPDGLFFVHGAVHAESGQAVTLIKGISQPLDEILAGSRQPEGQIPVTPDSVVVIAGLISNELFNCLAGTPKLLDRMLVINLADFHIAFIDV